MGHPNVHELNRIKKIALIGPVEDEVFFLLFGQRGGKPQTILLKIKTIHRASE